MNSLFNLYAIQLRKTLFFGFFFVHFFASSQKTTYTVFVSEQYRQKSVLSNATDNIPNLGRYIVPGGFQLVLNQSSAENYVRSVFETIGVPVISVTSVKNEATVQSVEKAGGNDCEAAQLLCSNTSQTANSSGAGLQEMTSSNQGCLGIEHQSSWYYLNVQTAGSLGITIAPNTSSDDYDFAIWGPFTSATAGANCPPISAPVRCSYSAVSGNTGLVSSYYGETSSFGCGFLGLFPCYGTVTVTDVSESASGDAWVKPLTASANEIYILLVDNYSNSGNPYAMSFSGSAVLGCTPVVLPVELSSFSAEKSGVGNLLSWTTESEDRSDYFTVEWTTDPISNNWIEVAKIYGAGQSTSELSYSAIHQSPSEEKINYYRLTLTDINGEKTIYSDRIQSVQPNASSAKMIGIFNLLGQQVDQTYHGIVIYQYADGTSRKVNQ